MRGARSLRLIVGLARHADGNDVAAEVGKGQVAETIAVGGGGAGVLRNEVTLAADGVAGQTDKGDGMGGNVAADAMTTANGTADAAQKGVGRHVEGALAQPVGGGAETEGLAVGGGGTRREHHVLAGGADAAGKLLGGVLGAVEEDAAGTGGVGTAHGIVAHDTATLQQLQGGGTQPAAVGWGMGLGGQKALEPRG